jgi:hypothetical protein
MLQVQSHLLYQESHSADQSLISVTTRTQRAQCVYSSMLEQAMSSYFRSSNHVEMHMQQIAEQRLASSLLSTAADHTASASRLQTENIA